MSPDDAIFTEPWKEKSEVSSPTAKADCSWVLQFKHAPGYSPTGPMPKLRPPSGTNQRKVNQAQMAQRAACGNRIQLPQNNHQPLVRLGRKTWVPPRSTCRGACSNSGHLPPALLLCCSITWTSSCWPELRPPLPLEDTAKDSTQKFSIPFFLLCLLVKNEELWNNLVVSVTSKSLLQMDQSTSTPPEKQK